MDPTEAFLRLVRQPDDAIPLDRAALLIAAHDHVVDIPAQLSALDELAARLPSDAAGIAHALFADLGFAGNTVDYGDPRNSFLDEVLRRRLGLPITLSVLIIEVARRRGDFALAGVAAVVVLDPDGRCGEARLALCGAGDRPVDAKEAAASLVGNDNVRRDILPSMAAEDFAWFLEKKPGAYIWIGNGSAENRGMLHSPHYDFNDAILPLGASYWVRLAESILSKG